MAASAAGAAGPSDAHSRGRLTVAQREEASRGFLLEVGYSEKHLTSMHDMVRYTQGRSGL